MSENVAAIDVTSMAGMFAGSGSVRLRGRDGKVVTHRLETDGWEAARDAWIKAHPEPQPPFIENMASELELRFLKTKGPASIRRYDPADVAFVAKKREWQDERNYAIVAHCLKIKLTRGGVELTSIEDRVEGLKAIGISRLAADQISDEVVRLSRLADEEAADFGGAS